MSPGLKSTNLYAPVPTGFKLFGASRDLAPLKGSNTCFGRIMPRTPQNASAPHGAGLWKTTRIVWLSTFSTLMSLYVAMLTDAVAGSATYSHVNTQSSAVNGLPSCHATLFLRCHVTDLPSLARPPFWAVGISAARTAERLPSGSQDASGSEEDGRPSLSLGPGAEGGGSAVAPLRPRL